MESIASLNQALRTLFFEEAPRLAKEQQVIKRTRCFSASSLLLVFVLGWLQHPLAGPSQLARFAHTVGVPVSKQAIAERLTEKTAHWLGKVLESAVSSVLFASSQAQGLLARFPAVILEDASSVQLPDALAFLWKGNGGSGSASSVKLGVRWDIRSGQLQGPILQDGKSHETQNPIHTFSLPSGGVWVADAGYYSLLFLRHLSQLGIFFVIRPRGNLAVSTLDGQRLALATHRCRANGTDHRSLCTPGFLPRVMADRPFAGPSGLSTDRRATTGPFAGESTRPGTCSLRGSSRACGLESDGDQYPCSTPAGAGGLAAVSSALANRVIVQTLEKSWACG